MPAIHEVWEQALRIHTGVATLHDDVAAATSRLGQSNDWLEEIKNLLASGLVSVTESLASIQARQDAMLRLLLHASRQQDTLISLLEQLSSTPGARPGTADRGHDRDP